MTDPIATLRAGLSSAATADDQEAADAALAELKRRAAIERRRDAYLDENDTMLVHCRTDDGRHLVSFGHHSLEPNQRTCDEGPEDEFGDPQGWPDFISALEATLKKAGAP